MGNGSPAASSMPRSCCDGLWPTPHPDLGFYNNIRKQDSRGNSYLLELENKFPGNGDGWKGMKLVYVLTSFFKQPFSYYEHNVCSGGKILERTFQKFRDCIGIQSRSVSLRGQISANRCLASGATTFLCNF